MLERGQDGVALGAVARRADLAHRLLLGPRRERLLDLLHPDRFPFAHDEEPLDQIPELAHVPGPGVLGKPLDGFRLELPRRTAVLLSEPSHEVPDQERNVLLPRAERLHVDGDDAQPVEEVLAEAPRLDLLGEILVRGRDDARVHLDRPGAAEPLDLSGLDGAEELGLGIEAHVADLVQEERPPVCGLQPSALHLRRSREGALLVAEELALHQVLGKRRAVQLLEGPAGARALVMDGPRDQLLARAALSRDEHLGLAPRHLRDLGADLLHGVTLAHHLVRAAREAAQRFVLPLERLQLQSALDRDVESVRAEGLLHEIGGAHARGADRFLDGAVSGHDDHGKIGAHGLRGLEQVDSVVPGKPEVREEKVDALPGEDRFRFLGALGGEDLVVALERARDLEQDRGLVVHHEHARARLAHEDTSGTGGRVNQARVPIPGWLSSPNRPECCSTIL